MRYDQTPQNPPSPQGDQPQNRPAGLPLGLIVGGVGLAALVGLTGVLVLLKPAANDEEPTSYAELSVPPTELPASVPPVEPEPEPMISAAEQLREAHAQVEDLQTELTARDAELKNLQDQLTQSKVVDELAQSKARARQAAIQNEIANLRTALTAAQDERDALRADLADALAEVDRQVKQNDRLRTTAVAFKEASSENLWFAFTNNAKIRICDRGTYKRRQACEEDLDAWFDGDQRADFTQCVNTQQAIPMLWRAEGDVIPAQARRVQARDRERGDEWYVIYCDPTLPEPMANRDITEEAAPVFASSAE